MKFSPKQYAQRQQIHHFFAIYPAVCCKCGIGFQFEFGYRKKKLINSAFQSYYEKTYVCNCCAHSKEEARKIMYKDE